MRALRSNRATDREIDAFVRQFGRKNQRSAARCGHILAPTQSCRVAFPWQDGL